MSKTDMSSVIPTIDLAADSPERQAELIKHALGSVGFFAVANAGPAAEDVAAMFNHSETFFGLSMPEKEVYLAGKSGSGYTKLLTQALGEGRRDHKETFSYGKFCATTSQPMPPPFAADAKALATIKRFYKACHDTSERLMELFALALEEHFRQSHSWGQYTAMSLIHYPNLTAAERAGLGQLDIRAGEHKDWGTMTLLFQQPHGEPGLEVYLPSSALPGNAHVPLADAEWAWHAAPVPPPGGFLVNVGLGMELWSGGNYRATLHRVVFPTAPASVPDEALRDRYTLAFFVQPDDDVPVLPGGKIDTSAKAITSGELFDMKLRESMNRSKALLEAAAAAPAQPIAA